MGLLMACEDRPGAVASVFGAVFLPLSAVSDGRMAKVCGEDPGFFCREVLNRTDNRTLAELSDNLLSTSLTIVAILIAAWLLNRLVGRGVKNALRTLHSGAVRERLGAIRRRTPAA